MRDFEKILKDTQDETLDEVRIYNNSAGLPNGDPKEAMAILKAIRLYQDDKEFAKEVEGYYAGKKRHV